MLVKSVEMDIGVKGGAVSPRPSSTTSRQGGGAEADVPDGFALKIDKAAAAERLKVFRAQLAEATRDRTART